MHWLDSHIHDDVAHYSAIFDHHLPTPAGFVIPHELLTDVFMRGELGTQVQQIIDLAHQNGLMEIDHAHLQLEILIRKIPLPRRFRTQVVRMYEQILEHERAQAGEQSNSLHKATHILKYIYHPPTVTVSTLPVPDHQTIASGETSIMEAIRTVLIEYMCAHIHHQSIRLPSVLIRRLPNAEYVGICDTQEMLSHDKSKVVIQANHGALRLDEAADVYMIDKSTLTITDRHVRIQPYKMVIRGNHYVKTDMHESHGARQILTDDEILQLAQFAKDVERSLYLPHRIDWVVEKGKIYVMSVKKI